MGYGSPGIRGNILQRLECLCFAHDQKEQDVHELSTAAISQVLLVGQLSLFAGADSVEIDLAQVLGMVVVARGEGLQAGGQTVERVIGGVVVVGEDDLEATIEFGSSKLAEVLVGEGQTDEVRLGHLRD